jgi:hypothetical protein
VSLSRLTSAFGRPAAAAPSFLGGDELAAAVQASMTPYAPFTAQQAVIDAGYDPNQPGGQLAQQVLTGLVNGNLPDADQVAEEVGAIAAGAAGAAIAGPIGGALGSVIGGAIGHAIGGLFGGGGGGGDDCDPTCGANKMADQIKAQFCTINATEQVDPACRSELFNAALTRINFDFALNPFFVKTSPVAGLPDQGTLDAFNAMLVQYHVPVAPFTYDQWHTTDVPIDDLFSKANDLLFRAMVGQAAARRHYADDIAWAQNVVIQANTMASKYGPLCASCDKGCLEQVQGYAVGYALAANPYREMKSSLVGNLATGGADLYLHGLTDESAQHNSCPTFAAVEAQCATQVGYIFQDGKCQTTEQYAAGKALGDAMQQALQNDCAAKAGSHWDPTKPGIGGRAGACVTTVGAWCTSADGQTMGVYDANGNCVQSSAYPGDDCMASDGPGSYDGSMTCVADHSDKTAVIRDCAGHADMTWDPATLECRPLRAGEDKYEVVLAKLKNKALAELAQQAEATAAVEQQNKTRFWLYALGAVAVGAAGWTGYRVYTKQPIVPPKATAYVKAIPAKVKGVFKGKK